ncbi:MAG: hypothetical protein ACOVOQ_05970 [Flavobacterium sp.]
MSDDNIIENSIIPISSTGIVRVGNSIEITKKIISQGVAISKNHSKVKIIPYNLNKKWELYDIDLKKIIVINSKIINLDEPRNLGYFYIVQDANSISIIDENEKNVIIGDFVFVKHNKEYILCVDFDKYCHLYKRNELICKFRIPNDYEFVNYNDRSNLDLKFDFNIINEKYIVLKGYNYSFSTKDFSVYGLSPIGYYDFSGQKLNSILEDSTKNNVEEFDFRDTLWTIKSNGLYYNNELKLLFNSYNDSESDVEISRFYLGFAFVKILVYENIESGISYYDDIGYIDVFGNIFWKLD